MADSNSQPARCPCGFWGSPQTLGLCSKCYKEKQNTESGSASQSVTAAATSTNGSSIPGATLSKAISISAVEPHSSPSSSTNGSSRGDDSSPKPEDGARADTNNQDTETPSSSSSSSMQPPKEPSPGSKRDASEVDALDPDRPIQKNKKRCFKCNTKLELAIREIGRCRCDYVFCQMHRLPEQHDCIYDHKEKGRQEARDKMISPKKHMGTSLKRIDSDS